MADFLLGLAVNAAAVLVLLGVVFGISVARDRHDLIDTFWGAGFAVVALVSLVMASSPQVLIAVLTAVWGVRLAVHIGIRNAGKPEDPRYVAIRKRAKGNPNLHLAKVVYLTQGVILLFVSLPVQAAQYIPAPPVWVVVLGVLVWVVGFVFETVGDWQLSRFKADPANKGKAMNTGLWRYTRHPNYFGECCVWWGFFGMTIAVGGWWSLLSPLVMTGLLLKVSGVALLEQDIGERRPAYRDYIRRTNAFFPGPVRRS